MAITKKITQFIEFTNADTLPTVGVTTNTFAKNIDTNEIFQFNGTDWSATQAVPSINIGVGIDTDTSNGCVVSVIEVASTYTLPLISSLITLNFEYKIKNLSGGDIIILTSGTDTFDTGDIANTSVTIPYGYTLSLFVNSKGYLITNNV
jgi:hypothetical protein